MTFRPPYDGTSMPGPGTVYLIASNSTPIYTIGWTRPEEIKAKTKDTGRSLPGSEGLARRIVPCRPTLVDYGDDQSG